jgi:hypothetical protein
VYALCAAVLLLAFVMAEDFSWRSMWPYYVLITMCAFQAWRPTMLVWSVLLMVFLLAVTTVPFGGTATIGERVFFATLTGLPVIALLLFRPRPFRD